MMMRTVQINVRKRYIIVNEMSAKDFATFLLELSVALLWCFSVGTNGLPFKRPEYVIYDINE